MIRILTRPEIEATETLKQAMAFHDRLLNSRLLTLLHIASKTNTEPPRLAFDNRVMITPLLDPISSRYAVWGLLDQKGQTVPWIDLPDLVGCPVTEVGYLQNPKYERDTAVPYLQFLNRVYLICETSKGGSALRHDRPREDAWDVLPLFPTSNC